ncbi:MAG: DNA-processing protein DprA [Candidatus Competibacteraceae bacterium]|nr:MAG: DNA-processing protein DprA [Candidatus Competibacteraceae bacterium]
MTPDLSPNTQAILLLVAPLLAGRGGASSDLLSPREYQRLARHLREMQRQPADLLAPDGADLLHSCHFVVEESRLQRLLGRGFLLSQVVERWQARAIWVISRADADYPRRLKTRLREEAPALLYGCGDIRLLETGGLAVVGSRHVDDSLIDYTMAIGRLAARAGRTLVSGGAKGIDRAAMRGALEAGGTVNGVLADGLERTAMNREHRNLLIDGQLALVSPYDPNAGFNVGHAMQRNKLIYALADASLVVNSDLHKGGTWAGAIEQLDKLRLVPVYVRSTGARAEGLDALRKKGAIPWPNPQDAEAFDAVLNAVPPAPASNMALPLVSAPQAAPEAVQEPSPPVIVAPTDQPGLPAIVEESKIHQGSEAELGGGGDRHPARAESSPADALFAAVREVLQQLLKVPMKETEVAAELEVSNAQAKAWLRRLAEEGSLENLGKPVRYVVRSQESLYGDAEQNRVQRTEPNATPPEIRPHKWAGAD